MTSIDVGASNHESPYEISWANPMISAHRLSAANILEYFCNLSNPFYDRQCNNEVIRMQRLSPEQLISMTGIEFYLYKSQEPVLFVIRKQDRVSQNKIIPLAYYYIVNGTVLQAPDLATIMNSRLHTVIAGLNKTIQTLAPCARYHPHDGSYSWDDPSTLMRKGVSLDKTTKTSNIKQQPKHKQPSDSNIATNPYQLQRMDCLLSEWANRFPLPPPPSTAGSALQTSAPIPNNQQLNTSNDQESCMKPVSGIPDKKPRLI